MSKKQKLIKYLNTYFPHVLSKIINEFCDFEGIIEQILEGHINRVTFFIYRFEKRSNIEHNSGNSIFKLNSL